MLALMFVLKFASFSKSIIRYLTIILFVVLIAACSSTRLVIDNIDWLMFTYLSSMVDLSDNQEQLLKQQLKIATDKIKVAEFKRYISLLNSLVEGLNSEITYQHTQVFYSQFRLLLNDLKAILIAALVPVSYQLTAGQIGQLQSAIIEKKPDYIDEEITFSNTEKVKARAQRWLDRIENWAGDLDDTQTETFFKASQQIPLMQSLAQDYKLTKLDGFIKLLKHKNKDQLAIQSYLFDWLIIGTEQSAEFQNKRMQYERKFPQFLFAIHKLLTGEQRKDFTIKLQIYIDELSSIVAEELSQNN